ncbi:unnamed protein product [Moneuplotes crassus]|uniref:Uncharacterized protein n=1 Tax=Euplotes crassus TaxID=5936 RepID=A0AAD1Y620_EUPCR|nr:unnamed protein product [Moneuplotes crassus]
MSLSRGLPLISEGCCHDLEAALISWHRYATFMTIALADSDKYCLMLIYNMNILFFTRVGHFRLYSR